MAQELELKLQIDPAEQSAWIRYLDGIAHSHAHTSHLANTYYDTPEGALRARKIALRVRDQAGVRKQTVKTAGTVLAGLSLRDEWETEYLGHFDFSSVGEPSIAAFLAAEATRLAPIFTTDFTRTRWVIKVDHARIEIALDQGEIRAQDACCPLLELECEYLPEQGDSPQLGHAALAQLKDRLSERFKIVTEDQSKAARGYALVRHAEPSKLDPDT